MRTKARVFFAAKEFLLLERGKKLHFSRCPKSYSDALHQHGSLITVSSPYEAECYKLFARSEIDTHKSFEKYTAQQKERAFQEVCKRIVMAEQLNTSRAAVESDSVFSFNTLDDYAKTKNGGKITSEEAEALKKILLNENTKNDFRYEESKKEAGKSLYKGAALGLAGSTILYVADKLFGDFIPWHLLIGGGKGNILPQIEAPKIEAEKPISDIHNPRGSTSAQSSESIKRVTNHCNNPNSNIPPTDDICS
jgi:hypothetical protein